MVIKQTKYIAVTKHRILTHGGFILKSKFNAHTIRLFGSPKAVASYFENHKSLSNVKYQIKGIKVTYEMEIDEQCVK